jgi:Co/Zn/Cd efflux system component
VDQSSGDGSSGVVDRRAGTGGGGSAESETSESKTAVVAALLGNVALTILKGISAAATGSAAMLAETFHSAADTGNEALLLLGMWAAQQPPDEQHPFGHGKNVYFWAFVVSVVLFSLGGAFWSGKGSESSSAATSTPCRPGPTRSWPAPLCSRPSR